jgi:hypothetical protein
MVALLADDSDRRVQLLQNLTKLREAEGFPIIVPKPKWRIRISQLQCPALSQPSG